MGGASYRRLVIWVNAREMNLLYTTPTSLGFRPHLYVQQLDLSMKMAPLNFQIFGRARNIPVMFAQLAPDIFFLKRIARITQGIVRLREHRTGCRDGRLRRCGRSNLQRETCLRTFDDISWYHDHQSLDEIPELADISRPVILLKHHHCVWRDVFHA